MSSSDRPRLGQLLVGAGVLEAAQLRIALAEHVRTGRPLGSTLVKMGLISESVLTRALASQLGLPVVTLAGKQIHPDILELLPAGWALKRDVVPLFIRDEAGVRTLFVGLGDPAAPGILGEIRDLVGMPAAAVVVAPSELEDALGRFYGPAALGEGLDAKAEDPTAAPASRPVSGTGVGSCSLAESQRDISRAASPDATPSARTVVKALAQILTEKGIITNEELGRRVQVLHEAEKDK